MQRERLKDAVSAAYMSALMFFDYKMPADVDFANNAAMIGAKNGVSSDEINEVLDTPLRDLLRQAGVAFQEGGKTDDGSRGVQPQSGGSDRIQQPDT